VELTLVVLNVVLILLALEVMTLGVVLMILVLKPKSQKFQRLKAKLSPSPETGQFEPDNALGRADGLTQEDIAWAYEHGAVNDQDVLDMVSKHKNQAGM